MSTALASAADQAFSPSAAPMEVVSLAAPTADSDEVPSVASSNERDLATLAPVVFPRVNGARTTGPAYLQPAWSSLQNDRALLAWLRDETIMNDLRDDAPDALIKQGLATPGLTPTAIPTILDAALAGLFSEGEARKLGTANEYRVQSLRTA
jgi:hypothetical protein